MKKMLIMLLSAILVLSAVGCSQTPPEVPEVPDVPKVPDDTELPDDTDNPTETNGTEGQLLDYDNYEEIVADIYLCDDVYRSKDTPTHGTASIRLPMAQDVLELKDYDILLCGDGCDPAAVVSRASQGYAPVYRIVSDGEIDGNFKILKFKMEIPEPMLEDIKKQGVYDQITEQLESKYFYLLVLDEKHYAYIHLERIEGAEKLDHEADFADSIVKNATINFEPRSVVREGFKNQTIQFAYQTTDGNSEMIDLSITLPADWNIVGDYKTYEMIPFKEYADLKIGENYVGGIGFLQYDIPEDQDIQVEGIFNQITMGAMTVWNIKQHFELVTEDDLNYKTALTSVLYAGKIFPDGKERTNSGIVSYHPGMKMYIALELMDGSKDREILTAEEIRYVAESIEWLYDENKAASVKEFSSDDAVELLKEQLIIAYENTYGEFVPSDEEPSTFTDDKERLSYIIPRLTVKDETDQYYIIPVIWDFYVDKETHEIFKYYNGLDEMFIPFDPQADTALSFAG